MKSTLFLLLIYANNATEWIQDVETQKLYLCDKVVGDYYDSNKEVIHDAFSLYDQRENLVLNHFFYMMNNCIQQLRARFPDSTVDESLAQQLDWLDIIQPTQFQYDERDLSVLTLEEMEVRNRMQAEKQLILENMERNQSRFTQFLKAWNLDSYTIAIYAIVVIMGIFFYNFILGIDIQNQQ